jgi:hypothetical protein
LKPFRQARIERTRAMTIAASTIFEKAGLPGLDFDRDVVPLTKLHEGGGITERHLCAAAARVLLNRGDMIAQLGLLGIAPSSALRDKLTDSSNPHRFYDLVGLFKTTLLDRVFLEPSDSECPPVKVAVDFARSVGAIPAYAYLGDVGESPTGDKKAEHFEDAYLDELFAALGSLGFQAVTYMPPRNTLPQLRRVQGLCAQYKLLEISGVDINSSRQSFHCPEVLQPEFSHLNDSTWALIAHEKLAARHAEWGLFHEKNPGAALSLAQRAATYTVAGRSMDPRAPSAIAEPRYSKELV